MSTSEPICNNDLKKETEFAHDLVMVNGVTSGTTSEGVSTNDGYFAYEHSEMSVEDVDSEGKDIYENSSKNDAVSDISDNCSENKFDLPVVSIDL